MNRAARMFHRKFAPWIAVPLFITLATGLVYRIGRAWFGMGKETGETILRIHTGAWLGGAGGSIYILLAGLGLLALTLTGLFLVFTSRAKGNPRFQHRILGALLLLPLTATALTGMVFHFGGKELPEKTGELLMSIHQGSWLGKEGRPFYVLFIGLGLLFLTATGLKMAGLFKKKAAVA